MTTETSNSRSLIAAQILQTRRYERTAETKRPDDGYLTERSGYSYIDSFHGLKNFFLYLSSLPTASVEKLVVDIGTGSGRGWAELAASPLNPGLKFEATALRASAKLRQVMEGGLVKIRLTTAEVLRGYQDNSVAGFTGLFSLTYSQDQALMAENLFNKLVPGGAIKAVFPEVYDEVKSLDRKSLSPPPLLPAQAFVQRLLALGCDVEWNRLTAGMVGVLAIKPGFRGGSTAWSLMQNDAEKFIDQGDELLVYQRQLKNSGAASD